MTSRVTVAEERRAGGWAEPDMVWDMVEVTPACLLPLEEDKGQTSSIASTLVASVAPSP